VKLEGGIAPFRWLANGRPLDGIERRRSLLWNPDSPGASKLTVIDAAGQAANVTVYID
jgi:penicillin-binding protein 1C